MNLFKFADIRRGKDSSDRVGQFMLGSSIILFLLFLVLPLGSLISKSLENKDGEFIGLANYSLYLQEPALFQSLYNSLFVAIISTIIVVVLAFLFAYAITRTCMPFKGFFKLVALIPLLSPSILAAIALVYWFGNQGVLKEMLLGKSIYGPIGIIMASVYWTFPHALIILTTSLSLSDSRLYEAAEVLKTSKLRAFFTITIPGARYGIISTAFVIFTQVFTDFGVPKVIGGNYNVLATDIYKQVIGQQNFQMGAVVAVVLLTPAIIAFSVDRFVQRKQVALLSSSAVPFAPKNNNALDYTMLVFCSFVAFLIICMIGMAQYASLITFWPYNLSFTLENFNFDLVEGGGWGSYFNSIKLSVYTALIGSIVIFFGAYLVEKGRGFQFGRNTFHAIAMVPLAVPGMALGLAYIFFFNNPNNPLNFVYGTMGILVISTITHFYTVSHLTATTALKQMDPEFESVSASLKTPFFRSFQKITLPICIPAILDISVYLFLNAMTTVSAVIFLYSANTRLASIAVLNMDDQGELAMAAAMAMMIAYTCGAVRLLYAIGSKSLIIRTQKWRDK